MEDVQTKIGLYNRELQDAPAHEVLAFFLEEYKGRIAFATSLGAEDQVITQMIDAIDPSTPMFTLDTGRLFQETYDLIEKTNARYNIQINIMFPDNKKVEDMVKEHGINLFYQSVDFRKLCCHIRKIEPLTRALEGMEAWISGLRNEQSVTRKDISVVEWDDKFKLIKINPLKDWTEDQLWNYIHDKNIPYNTLHDQGYPSIGCLPCTRPVEPGQDIRSGRWWWELPEMKECGLHKK
jgi:phosphoadenosine phosphosulfate reductase